MQSKLTLKELSAYLPYGLKFMAQGEGKTIFEMVGIANLRFIELHEIGRSVNEEFEIEDCFSLLRPLSDLTKEIEHNGEKFVPLEVIARMIEPEYILIDKSTFDFNVINESIGYDKVFQLRYKTDYDNYKKVVMLNFHEKEKCFWHTERIIPFSCIEKLLEWNFDVFGLIEQGLAIQKN